MDKTQTSPLVRCAIYVRSATNDKTSLAAQEQSCRAAVAKQSPTWTIVEDCIFTDTCASGVGRDGRPGLDSLLERAKECPKPFHYIVIADTSRLGRNLSRVLQIMKILKDHGIEVCFVEQKLDSRDPNFLMQVSIPGIMQEEYISALREKVRRGQHGRVQEGYTPGGRCFGYESDPDLVRDVANGNHRRLGTRLRIVPSEAETIRTIYRLFAEGVNVSEIARRLNDNSVPGPKKPATGNVSNLWNARLVRGILKRERYRGTAVWNRTTRVRNPATGQIESRRKPDDEIIRIPMPELRIVDDEVSAKVDERLNSIDEPGDG